MTPDAKLLIIYIAATLVILILFFWGKSSDE